MHFLRVFIEQMSFASGFRFKDYTCDASIYEGDASIDAVTFSMYTNADIQRTSVVTINVPHHACEKTKPWEPHQRLAQRYSALTRLNNEEFATLFDARMGNVDCGPGLKMPCTTCRNVDIHMASGNGDTALVNIRTQGEDDSDMNPRCTGHYGKIDLPFAIVNPFLLKEALLVLRSLCWKCLSLRLPQAMKVQIIKVQLALLRGDSLTAENEVQLALSKLDPKVSLDTSFSDAFSREASVSDEEDDSLTEVEALEKTLQSMSSNVLPTDNIASRVRGKILKAFAQLCPKKCPHCGYKKPISVKLNNGILFYEAPTDDLALMNKLKELSPWQMDSSNASFSCIHPGILRYLFDSLFQNENTITNILYGRLFGRNESKNCATSFLINHVLVPPNSARVWQRLGSKSTAIVDSVTEQLSSIIMLIYDHYTVMAKEPVTLASFERSYKEIQSMVSKHFTTTINSFLKKGGLFRSNMMGKRTNQACRTVISPDTYLATNTINLSVKFASRLTFPESLAFCSDERRRFLVQCIENGPSIYPGATHLELRMREGSVQTISLKGKEKLLKHVAEKMLKQVALGCDVIVHRHVVNDDMIILNRQPTLHKSSMLGQRAVVRGSDYTMRFHYANCKGFNADFDGDEMNCHIPQGIKCRTELKCLMDAESHYFSASSGKPLRGLIQDHLVAAYRLTCRERFFEREEFISLLYEVCDNIDALPQPCVCKPRALWSGKQLISELIKNVSGIYTSQTRSGLTTRSRCTTHPRYHCFEKNDTEDEMLLVHRSEILTGVLDSANIGLSNGSLVHFIHDTYGPKASGSFLAICGRLLSAFMRQYSLTISLSDLCIYEDLSVDSENRRLKMLDSLDQKANVPDESHALRIIADRHTKINTTFYPHKALVRFPANNLMLMTAIGARGSYSNAFQMMIALGQQYFDSKRMSCMESGKVLPGTLQGDRRAKCHGFVKGRFISGIRPQEYFIHASAGRDGIIDTAVKTARSGYLQRCLIKGMESSVVQWDGSVHNGEGELIQFMYGGDGLDPSKNMMNNDAHVLKHMNDFEVKQQCLQTTDRVSLMCQTRKLLARCEPGEPVGLIAAQSLGEPSTQMTLNTFHHTGSTSSHVTEGIPRVRELLSFSTKNPTVTLPLAVVDEPEIRLSNSLRNTLLKVPIDTFLSSASRKPFSMIYDFTPSGTVIELSLLFSRGALQRRNLLLGSSDEQFKCDFIKSITLLLKSMVSKIYKNMSREDSKALHSIDAAEEEINEIQNHEHDVYDESEDRFTTEATQTEVETDNGMDVQNHIDTMNAVSGKNKVKAFETLTNWTRPSIRLSKASSRHSSSATIDCLRAHSYLGECDSFEVSCKIDLPAKVAIILPDILKDCLATCTLQNSSFAFSGDLSICEIYRDPKKASGSMVFQGKAATLTCIRTIATHTSAHSISDWQGLVSSDPHDICHVLGVEAARAYLESELNRLFQGYSVNFRHTMLVADTMSHSGELLPFSRYGLVRAASASPFLQMTFETGGIFLHECLKNTNYDALRSFSSSLIVGKKPAVGTNFGKVALPVTN